MAEIEQMMFGLQDVAELLVKKAGHHEGIWTLVLEFQFGATLAGTPDQAIPTALLGISRIGLQRGEAINSVSVDAAIVNPSNSAKPPVAKRAPKK